MLKGFVSGVEKDIVRIPMKGKNLFNKGTITTSHYANTSGTIENSSYYCSDFIPITAATYYFQNAVGSSYQNTVVVYDANKQGLRYVRLTGGAKVSGAITFQSGDAYIRINCHYQTDVDTVMINEGSTALPYEPYGYQEGWEVRDNQDRLIWGREDELQTTTGTLQLKGYGLSVKVKSLLGNSQQSGTPTPDAPIMPEFTGVRTGNLFDINGKNTANGYANNTQLYADGSTAYWSNGEISEYITVDEDTQYTLTNMGSYNTPAYCFYDTDKQYISGSGYNGRSKVTFTTPSNCKYVRLTHVKTQTKTMLNLGSTALPYEPYGYKIPFTNAGQTTPVYLGEVPTVRRIKKLVLTGEETFVATVSSTHYRCRTTLVPKGISQSTTSVLSTHYVPNAGARDGTITLTTDGGSVYFTDDINAVTVEAFISYLTQQYAAGTPVTVWYVLAEPETAIVNEPLAKIGDYADELNDTVATLPEIPTTTGQNTLTVDTTLAPSNLTIKGHVKQSS